MNCEYSTSYGNSITCDEFFDCCDCGGHDCGCRYCWSCGACETCKESEDE